MEKGHYTLTEIGRQHEAFAITRNQFPAFAQIIEEVKKEGFTKILFMGCGTSYFLAGAASAYFARFNDITCDYLASFEFYKNTDSDCAAMYEKMAELIEKDNAAGGESLPY